MRGACRGPALARCWDATAATRASTQPAMEAAILDATRRVVKLQADCGIDVANNGEQARESFFTYVPDHRMSGFGGQSDRPGFADMRAYPSFLE